ncbi:MAG: indole-3-glycerol phosphate synthase [Planctomycetota bacterium]|nr:MAG: indole-3-glycerol phosphate synthase [Planctomycetota bacterium]
MILDKIVSYKKEFNLNSKRNTSLEELSSRINDLPSTRGFLDTLKNSSIGLIAEIKKASPSKGIIQENFNPESIAKSYLNTGATCVSCLTDEKYFQGSQKIFEDVRNVLNIPMLRKDFTIDEYNIYEARAMGADAILLIVSILEKNQMKEYCQIANDLGMDALFEIHNEEELDEISELKPELIGINNRNLKTFETSINISLNLIPKVDFNAYIVSESALKTRQDIEVLSEAGANGFLIGETFMKEEHIENKMMELFPNL